MAAENYHKKSSNTKGLSLRKSVLFGILTGVLLSSCGGLMHRHQEIGFGGGWSEYPVTNFVDTSRRDSSKTVHIGLQNFDRAKKLCSSKILLIKDKANEIIAKDSLLYKAGLIGKAEH